MKLPVSLIVLPVLFLGCVTPSSPYTLLPGPLDPLPLKTECRQGEPGHQEGWLPGGFKPSLGRPASSAGRIPDFGPAGLFIRPTERLQIPVTGESCGEFQPLLAELCQPRWAPPEGSRVRLVDREEEADWVLESRLDLFWVQRVLAPAPKRQWYSILLFRLRDRRSGQLLWACHSAPDCSQSAPEFAAARSGLEAHLGRHWAHLQQHLNAGMNGSPGVP